MKIRILPYPTSTRTEDQFRFQTMHQWMTRLQYRYELIIDSLQYVAREASTRRYYRIRSARSALSFIIMDSAPWLEDNATFVAVAGLLASASISVPEIYEWDKLQGFLLLEDMGEGTLLELNLSNDCDTARKYYYQAINTLLKIQLNADADRLPTFSSVQMRQELELFVYWHINQNLRVNLKKGLQQKLSDCFDLIAAENQSIAKVFVHRDYRPGNLIVSNDRKKISVLDFQDAVKGPITYDLVSLMWDSFHCWDDKFISQMVFYYWSSAVNMQLPVPTNFYEFKKHVYWTSLQRHLRVIGNFARLGVRDGKKQYIQEIHRFNNYLISNKPHDKKIQSLIDLLNWIYVQPCQ